MLTVRSGDATTVQVPLADLTVPTTALYTIEGQDGAALEIGAATPIAGFATVTVSAVLNTLAVGALSSFRLVRVRYQTAALAGVWQEAELGYRVVASQQLVVMTNSFMVYNQALAVAGGLSDIAAFLAADRPTREVALMQAFRSIVRLRFDLDPYNTDRLTHVVDFPGQTPGELARFTAAEYLSLDSRFIAASQRAQIVEAETVLGAPNDPRRNGLVSSREGEISETFRNSSPLDIGISRRAAKELSGYLALRPRLTRG